MCLAVLSAQLSAVALLDEEPKRVDQVNRQESRVVVPHIEVFSQERSLSLIAILHPEAAYSGADFAVEAAPPSYDSDTSRADTKTIYSNKMHAAVMTQDVLGVLKSIVSLGYTRPA